MLLTLFLLAAVYLLFLAFLVYSGAPQMFMVLFIGAFMGLQYYYSDRLVLWTMHAKIVTEQEAPDLHQTITGPLPEFPLQNPLLSEHGLHQAVLLWKAPSHQMPSSQGYRTLRAYQ